MAATRLLAYLASLNLRDAALLQRVCGDCGISSVEDLELLDDGDRAELIDAMKAAGCVLGDRAKIKQVVTATHIAEWLRASGNSNVSAKQAAAKPAIASGTSSTQSAGLKPTADHMPPAVDWRDQRPTSWMPESERIGVDTFDTAALSKAKLFESGGAAREPRGPAANPVVLQLDDAAKERELEQARSNAREWREQQRKSSETVQAAAPQARAAEMGGTHVADATATATTIPTTTTTTTTTTAADPEQLRADTRAEHSHDVAPTAAASSFAAEQEREMEHKCSDGADGPATNTIEAYKRAQEMARAAREAGGISTGKDYWCKQEVGGTFVVQVDEHAEHVADPRLFTGKGRFDFPGGGWYAGDWLQGKKHGRGILHAVDGTIFNGEFLEDAMHGLMMCVTPDGQKYEGEYRNGMMCGTGIMDLPQGQRYEGEFYDGQMHGTGRFSWADGQIYDGSFDNGMMHGRGVYTWPNGQRYEGSYVQGKRRGACVMHLPDGTRREGECDGNAFVGAVVETYPDNTVYRGPLHNGRRHGEGTMAYANGQTYKGGFVDGQRHGHGTFVYSDGRQYVGDFVCGCMEGQGVETWPDGSEYTGAFKNNKRNGNGRMVHPDGDVEDGEWVDDEFVS